MIGYRGKADNQVNPAGEGDKFLRGGEASRALGVEKRVDEETS
jgi:hypothetical protein